MSDDYTLAYGTHVRPEDGRCAMEWSPASRTAISPCV